MRKQRKIDAAETALGKGNEVNASWRDRLESHPVWYIGGVIVTTILIVGGITWKVSQEIHVTEAAQRDYRIKELERQVDQLEKQINKQKTQDEGTGHRIALRVIMEFLAGLERFEYDTHTDFSFDVASALQLAEHLRVYCNDFSTGIAIARWVWDSGEPTQVLAECESFEKQVNSEIIEPLRATRGDVATLEAVHAGTLQKAEMVIKEVRLLRDKLKPADRSVDIK